MTPREWVALLPLVACMFWIGLFPQYFIDRMEPSIQPIADRLVARQKALTESGALRSWFVQGVSPEKKVGRQDVAMSAKSVSPSRSLTQIDVAGQGVAGAEIETREVGVSRGERGAE